jgi:nucleoside phosphorylase
VVRSISDGADGDQNLSYEQFREEAAAQSAKIIINTIKNI